MKTHKHLYEEFISDRNILLAIKNASKHKLDRERVKQIHDNPQDYVEHYRNCALNYKSRRHKPKIIYDGIQRKKRTIIVPAVDEQVIHHMTVNILKPIFMKSMYEHSYGSIPERGSHKGMKRIRKWIRKGGRNIKYCLKMDIRKYFESIPHDILNAKLEKIIKDEKFLALVEEIVRITKVGIPIGFYTSQWIANWYLTELDHKIKEEFGAVYYVRYMDDMVIFGSSKKSLHKIRVQIEEYLSSHLGLTLKDNWQIFRFDYIRDGKHYGRFLDFMGFRFYRDRVTLRHTIFLKAKRKAKRISKKGRANIHDARQIISYMGWFKHSDTYGAYLAYIKPYVNIQNLKRRISDHDRRMEDGRRELLAG